MARMTELEPYLRYAEKLRQELPPLREQMPEPLKPRIERVLNLAEGVIRTAEGPLRIGVVGEFSSGKSLLLGAMMGCADALPVNEVPTTGNITSIHFSQLKEHGEDRPCIVDTCRIVFLTRDEVIDCRTHMTEVAQSRLASLGVQLELRQRLLAAGADDASSNWQALERCCQDIWAATPNPEVRYLIKDLMHLSRAYVGLGMVLCGRHYTVRSEVARAALALADTSSSINLGFTEMLPQRHVLEREPAELDTATVRAAFHLIRYCEFEVRVARKIWDLSSLKGRNDFVLLDFPGLGASRSSVRDEYLCRREMKDVQTILLLINGRQPGAGEADRLFTMMQEGRHSIHDAILVGIGRFDQLKFQGDEQERIQRILATVLSPTVTTNLASDDGFFGHSTPGGIFDDPDNLEPTPALSQEKLTEQQVREGIQTLSEALTVAAGISSGENRTALLSPVIYLGELRRRVSQALPENPAFAAELEKEFELADRARQTWRGIVERLASDGSTGQLTKSLAEFVDDGGIKYLRRMLEEHVTEHGVRQLTDAVIRQTEEICSDIKRLLATLPEPAADDQPVVDINRSNEIETGLRELKRTYLKLKNDLKNNPPDLMIDLATGGTMRLVDYVREEVVKRVYSWPQWPSLFVLVRDEDCLVDIAKGRGSSRVFGDDDAADIKDLSGVPMCAKDLEEPFRDTYKALQEQVVHRLSAQAVEAWLDRLSGNLKPIRSRLRDFFDADAHQRIEADGSSRRLKTFENLRKAMDPTSWGQSLIQLAFETAAPKIATEGLDPSTQYFPLNEKRRFAWDPSLDSFDPPVKVPDSMRHYSWILRIRTGLAASLSRYFQEQVSAINQIASKGLVQAIDVIATRYIEECLADAKLLRLLVGSRQTEPAENASFDPRLRLRTLYEAKPDTP